jgi:hypothetical protein
MPATIIYGDKTTLVNSALIEGDNLWLSSRLLKKSSQPASPSVISPPCGRATVLVNPRGGLPTRPAASGIDLRIPAVDLWTTRLCFMRGLGMVASTECCHEPWH